MKNDSHPLLQALKRRSNGSEAPSLPMPEEERLFQIKKEDIPPLAKFDAGDNAKFVVHGKIRSTHDDGTMMMQVHKVEHQNDDQDATEAPKEPISVRTEESHRP